MRRIKQQKVKTKKAKSYFKYILLTLLLFVIYIITKVFSESWDSSDKFTYLTKDVEGFVEVVVVDSKLSEITTIKIPNNTEVEVARGYGTLTIGNVWQLGINEKIGGELLTETVTKNFYFPVSFWWNKDDTNIKLIDRIKLGLYMKKLDRSNRTEIDMAKSQFLKKVKLADGSNGYGLVGNVSSRLTVYFSDYDLEDKNIKISIIDATGRYGVAETLGAIAEVLGGKIVSIERNQVDNDLFCNVSGKNKDSIDNIVEYFKCTKVSDTSDFDLEIKIGKKFLERL